MEYLAVFFIAVSLFVGVFLLIKPNLAIWAILIWAMIISGTVIYFFPVAGTIQWGNALLALLLFVRLVLDILTGRAVFNRPPFFFYLMGLFIFVAVLTSLVDLQAAQFVISSKNYFQFWSLPLALFFIIRGERTVERWMKFFLYLALFLPFLAIVQFLYFSGNLFPGDSVTGTFGGSIRAGGPNAMLSVFIVLQMAVLLIASKEKLLSLGIALVCCSWLFIILFLTNAKAVFLFVPIMIGFVYYKHMLRSPFKFLFAGTFIAVLLLMMLQFYLQESAKYTGQEIGTKSYSEFFDRAFKSNFGTDNPNRLNRLTVYSYWYEENTAKQRMLPIIFGHGLGAAKWAGIEKGHIQALPRYQNTKLAPTALARLLWDVGIVGAIIYILIFVSGFFAARKLVKSGKLPHVHDVFMQSAQLACLFYIFSLPYKLSILNIQAVNFHAMFILSFIAFWHAKLQMEFQKTISDKTALK